MVTMLATVFLTFGDKSQVERCSRIHPMSHRTYLTVLSCFDKQLFLLLSAVDIETVVSACCNEGNEWGTQRKHCNEYKFNLDKNIVPAGLQGLCLSTVEICCAKQHRIYQCTGTLLTLCQHTPGTIEAKHRKIRVLEQISFFLFPPAGSVAAKSSSSCDSTSDNYGTEFFKVDLCKKTRSQSENNPKKTS